MVVIKTYNIKIKDMSKFNHWVNNFNPKIFYKIYGIDIEIKIRCIFLLNKCSIEIYKSKVW